MAKHKNRAPKIIGLIAILAIPLLFIVTLDTGQIVADSGDQFEGTHIIIEEHDEENDEENIISTNSILKDQLVLAESDDDAITIFLDSFGDSNIFGIQTVVVKVDLAGNKQESTSDILPVVLSDTLSVLDQGFLVDNLQVRFFAVTGEPVIFLNLQGTVQFWLDDKVIIKQDIFVEETGKGRNTIPLLFVDSNRDPSFSDREETFDFTFKDEQFGEGTEHTFRAVITFLKGKLTTSSGEQKFQFSSNHVAYELKIKVDKDKTVVLDENNQPLEVLKSDSKIVACSQGNVIATGSCGGSACPCGTSPCNINVSPIAKTPKIIVQQTEQFIAGTMVSEVEEFGRLEPFGKDETRKLIVGKEFHPSGLANFAVRTCEIIDNIPRGESIEIVINDPISPIGDRTFTVQTPIFQQNYNINCIHHGGRSSWTAGNSGWIYTCTSNFGYNYTIGGHFEAGVLTVDRWESNGFTSGDSSFPIIPPCDGKRALASGCFGK